ncbi:hypothetical protein HHK36_033467 [Tetracentron sinense]|uniref:Uncharacterized protein n=1 Tax=Tetracentron sinense TaxID=13715 RepID=A0A835CWS6_TETSI|nr:hypothetical protein HHK36_033467 [Tetracentron sinense]
MSAQKHGYGIATKICTDNEIFTAEQNQISGAMAEGVHRIGLEEVNRNTKAKAIYVLDWRGSFSFGGVLVDYASFSAPRYVLDSGCFSFELLCFIILDFVNF